MWVLLLVSHLGWFLKGLRGEADAVSTVLLGLTLSLFLLKSLDVPFLRVNWTRKRLLAAVVIVLLLHVGVIHDAVDADIFAWTLDENVSFIRLSILFSLIAFWLGLVSSAGNDSIPAVSVVRHAITALLRRQRQCALTVAPLRGPPLA